MQPIPVIAAANIAHEYQKSVVVITAIDSAGYVHTATYGTSEDAARFAADLGEILNAVTGGDLSKKIVYQDLPKE